MGLATQYQAPPHLSQPHFTGTDNANWGQNYSDWCVWLGQASESGLRHALQDGQNDGWRGEAETSTDPSHQVEPFLFILILMDTVDQRAELGPQPGLSGRACYLWVT